MVTKADENCYEDKLITKEIDEIRNSQFGNWQMNPNVASMRFSSTSDGSGYQTMVGLKQDHIDDDTESVRIFRAESLSS